MSDGSPRSDRVPRHVAIIMDGNGRWAERRGLSRNEGHRQGLEAVRAVVRAAGDLDLEVLTLYAFSLENWNRPQAEVSELMRLLDHYLDVELEEVIANDIRVRAIGRLDRVPPSLRKRVDDALERTRHGRAMTLAFALSYGGRAEIWTPPAGCCARPSSATWTPSSSTRRRLPPTCTRRICRIRTC